MQPDGDEVMVGPYEFNVIHTPGHAAEGIVLYNKKEKHGKIFTTVKP